MSKVFIISVDGLAADFIRQTSIKVRQPRQLIADDWAQDRGIRRKGVEIIDVTDIPMSEIQRAFEGVPQ